MVISMGFVLLKRQQTFIVIDFTCKFNEWWYVDIGLLYMHYMMLQCPRFWLLTLHFTVYVAVRGAELKFLKDFCL